MENKIVLPTSKSKAKTKSPRNLIIFSRPKIGKSSLCAELDNWLHLDLEQGVDFLEVMSVTAKSYEDILAIGKEVKASSHKYNGVIIDTVTALEEMALALAEKNYANTPMGKDWFKADANGKLDKTSGKAKYKTITGLPNGQGYGFLRTAVDQLVTFIQSWAPRTIMLGHVKLVSVLKDGAEFSASEIDLTGKISRMLAQDSDGIGYLYRGKNNQNILSFKTTDETVCGTRSAHLRNQEIVISEFNDKGEFITHWDKVFID